MIALYRLEPTRNDFYRTWKRDVFSCTIESIRFEVKFQISLRSQSTVTVQPKGVFLVPPYLLYLRLCCRCTADVKLLTVKWSTFYFTSACLLVCCQLAVQLLHCKNLRPILEFVNKILDTSSRRQLQMPGNPRVSLMENDCSHNRKSSPVW